MHMAAGMWLLACKRDDPAERREQDVRLVNHTERPGKGVVVTFPSEGAMDSLLA